MTVSVSPTEQQQWIPAKDRSTGRPLYVAVPSKSRPNAWHLVSSAGCDCKGYSYRGTCSHYTAMQAEAMKRQPAPAQRETRTYRELFGEVE